MIALIRIWLARHCLECGQPKPKFTAVCDDCFKRFRLDSLEF